MKIGAKIYYDKLTGNVILDLGERTGAVVESTQEQDFATYVELAERVPSTIGMIQLEYGAYAADRATGGVVTRIDLETHELFFTFPDPLDPDTSQEPQPALSAQIEALKKENDLLKAQNSALADRADFIEDCIAEMAQKIYQ